MKALITGASSGIGKDIACILSNLGYDLIVVARRKNILNELKKEVKTFKTIINFGLQINDIILKVFVKVTLLCIEKNNDIALSKLLLNPVITIIRSTKKSKANR